MGETFGRFILEESADSVRLRVRSADTTPLVRTVSIVCFSLAGVYAAIDFANVFEGVVAVASALALLLTAGQNGAYWGVAQSIYPRIRRLLEIRWEPPGDAPFRSHSNRPTLTLDGRSFGPVDVVGVVIATSTERVPTGGKYDKKVERFRPTLILHDRAIELDMFEEPDSSDGRVLADALATAIAKHPAKARDVAWDPPYYQLEGGALGLLLGLFQLALLIGGGLSAVALCVSHSGRGWILSLFMALLLGANLATARLTIGAMSRERSRRARKLLENAARAVSRT